MSTPSDKTLRLERTKLTPQAPKGGRNTTLILAVIAGFAAAALALLWLKTNSQPKVVVVPATVAPPPPTPVVITNQDIPAREVITSSMIQLKTVDQKDMEPNAVSSPQEVIGQVAVLPIKTGQQVTKDEIGPPIYPVEGLAGIIPPGKRAMTIALNPTSSVAGFVKPGDHVDVMGTFDLGRGHTIERAVLQNVLLLATGSQVIQTTPVPPANTSNNNGALGTSSDNSNSNGNPDNDQPTTPKPTEVPNATVEVTPVDAEKLILAGSKGVLMLALRSAKDTFPTVIPIVDASTVTGHRFDDVGAAAPVVAPPIPPMPPIAPVQALPTAPATISITVIKGSDARQVTVSP
ncbi:MAG: Flp pilus assembly protein CpaB [Capsulimonadaceae bacterium]